MNKIADLFNSFRTFLEEVKVELLKCSWPSRKELFGSAVVVIVSVIILGAFVGACDMVNMGLMNWIIR